MIAEKYKAGLYMTLLSLTMHAQYTVNIQITGLPATPRAAALYMGGSFNNWNPQDAQFKLQPDAAGTFFIEWKGVAAGVYECKFTRGGWNTVETDAKGEDIPNRVINISGDTTLHFTIQSWQDAFVQKRSTASPQVTVMDTAFVMPQLNRTRRIWLYLPKEYQSSTKQYPVLYMHDGQNLFDNATSFAGEWDVDDAMDTFKNACIVVGIDNGGLQRMNEYNPNDTKRFGKGEGRAYLSFIVTTLKPFIDGHYRTLAGKQHTFMAGSSMGGLITFYAGLYYPEVFGRLGLFSPSFWIVPELDNQVKQLATTKHAQQQYYFYAGGAEDKRMETGMQAIADVLQKAARPQINKLVLPAGKHNEATWSLVFPVFYKWITRNDK